MAENSSKPKTPARLTKRDEAEMRQQKQLVIITEAFGLFKHLITCLALVLVAYFCYRGVSEMSGKSTDFRSTVDWMLNFRMSEFAAWALVAVLTGAVYKERKARKKMAEQAGPRLAQLEAQADPARTSSGLMEDGTNPSEGSAS